MELCDIINEIDIVEYINNFVELTEKNGEYWGLSPFKEEKTPSFSVRREAGRFYDFSSGIGGNVFTFVKHFHKCSSKEAVDMLKKYLGIEGEVSLSQKPSAIYSFKKYKKPVKVKKESQIKVYPENCMEKYEKKDEKLAIWELEGISREVLDEYEVYYDSFSDRLVYPIRNLSGEIVNIGGRTLDPLWKEKGLRKYTYFSSWGEMSVIYGLFDNMEEILKNREIILFEGCKSVLLAASWGIKNTGAILTSHLNPNQMKILARLGVNVVFALDKDVDIKKDHNIEILKRYLNVYYIKDDGDMLNEKDSPVDKGKEVFKELYEHRFQYR